VGWWTFEDGPDDDQKAQDVSEHRAPTYFNRYLPVRTYDEDHETVVNMNGQIQLIRKNALNDRYDYTAG
jgi:hypothetical protein